MSTSPPVEDVANPVHDYLAELDASFAPVRDRVREVGRQINYLRSVIRDLLPYLPDDHPRRPGFMEAAMPPQNVGRIVAKIMTGVCELGGYTTSPDGQPDLLQCTVSELETCIRRALGEDV